MKSAYRIGALLALAVVGGSGLMLRSAARHAPVAALESDAGDDGAPPPALALSEAGVAALTKIQVVQPDWGDAGERPPAITLERRGDRWDIASPIAGRASASKVDALLANLKSLALRGRVERGTDAAVYAACHVTSDQAVHVTAWAGDRVVRDLFFGKSDDRGQLVRVGGVDGVFAIGSGASGGYQGFLYTRPLRSWRETEIFHFDPEDVAEVDVSNRHGRFVFTRREGSGWVGTKAAPGLGDRGDAGAPEWRRFDPDAIDRLVAAMRSLAADDFGDESQRAGAGTGDAERTGGVLRVRFVHGADGGDRADRVLRVGAPSTNVGRWAIPGSRWAVADEGEDRTLYALAPWTADWATGDAARFEKTSEIQQEPRRATKPE